jgi:integrase
METKALPRDFEMPCAGVRRFRETSRERLLSVDEAARLWGAIEGLPEESHLARDVLLTLALTGARRSEIMKLRWSEVDFGRAMIVIADGKTGRRVIHLPPDAIEILERQRRSNAHEWVFASKGGKPIDNIYRTWGRVTKAAGLSDFRPHDMRHAMASTMAAQGHGLLTIGKALGHKRAETTNRYAHLVDAAAAHAVAGAALAISGKAAR